MTKHRSNQWQWLSILGGLLAIGGVVYSSGSKVQEIDSRSKENRNLIQKTEADVIRGNGLILHRFDRMEDKVDFIIKRGNK